MDGKDGKRAYLELCARAAALAVCAVVWKTKEGWKCTSSRKFQELERAPQYHYVPMYLRKHTPALLSGAGFTAGHMHTRASPEVGK